MNTTRQMMIASAALFALSTVSSNVFAAETTSAHSATPVVRMAPIVISATRTVKLEPVLITARRAAPVQMVRLEPVFITAQRQQGSSAIMAASGKSAVTAYAHTSVE